MRHIIIMAMLCITAVFTSCGNDSDDSADIPVAPPTNTFQTGADISWVTEMEQKGHKFYNTAGNVRDIFSILKSYGLGAVRLRVWVDPAKHGGWCSADDVLHKALRAKAMGMDVMIDFHYSDWWADPSRQDIPQSWLNHSYGEMKEDVYRHTASVLQLLKDNGIYPRWVQVGNETSNGLLWPVGRADKNPEQYAGLFSAGYNAAKDVFPTTKVIVHLDNGADAGLYDWNLGILKSNGARWDVIGMSVYPYWSMKSGRYHSADEVISKSVGNIIRLGNKFNCKVIVVETGMECADDNGRLAGFAVLNESRRQLHKLISSCKNDTYGICEGVFYWEPECKPGDYRLGAFTEDGRPTVIMNAFTDI